MLARVNHEFFWMGLAASLAVAWLGACGSTKSDASGMVPASAGPNNNVGVGGSSDGFNLGSSAATGGAALAPETKVELTVETPQASQNYVYAANPDRDSVSVINPSRSTPPPTV